jgi:hypothetical protein
MAGIERQDHQFSSLGDCRDCHIRKARVPADGPRCIIHPAGYGSGGEIEWQHARGIGIKYPIEPVAQIRGSSGGSGSMQLCDTGFDFGCRNSREVKRLGAAIKPSGSFGP